MRSAAKGSNDENLQSARICSQHDHDCYQHHSYVYQHLVTSQHWTASVNSAPMGVRLLGPTMVTSPVQHGVVVACHQHYLSLPARRLASVDVHASFLLLPARSNAVTSRGA